MVTFNAQFDHMGDVRQALQGIAAQLLSIGDTLRRQVDTGTAEFHGATKDQFVNAQLAYDRAHEALQDVVSGSSTALGGITDAYINNERRGASRWTI